MTIKLGVGGLMARPLAEELFCDFPFESAKKEDKKDVICYLEKERKKSE